MRLTKSNIKFVKRYELNGMTYGFYVGVKGNDGREFINYENGRTVAKEYKAERLPASVRAFLKDHAEEVWTREENGDDEFVQYITRS